MKKWFAWIQRNERHLSTAVFAIGFLIDNIAYERVDLPWVGNIFVGFLLGAALCIILRYALEAQETNSRFKKPTLAFLQIAAQFFIGGLLSGCLIFYTRSASILSSWPFLLLLVGVFVGNEFLRKYKERLTFQITLFFFALYAYAIFALPIARGEISPIIFIESGLMSIVVLALFLWLLRTINEKRLMESIRSILISTGAIFILVNLFYFTGILPPLPLSLRDAGVYHSVVRTGAGYDVEREASSGFFFSTQVVHITPGAPLYAYSAVFAPVSLSTPIVHRWEKYNDSTHSWDTIARATYAIAGGRDSGYRGYSILTNASSGAWRVSIETESGAVLGRVRFNVSVGGTPPTLYTELK